MKSIHHSYRNICFAFFHIISEVQILTLQMQKPFWSSSHLHKITRNNRYFIFIILFSYIDFVLNGFSRIQHQNWYFFGVCSYIRQKKLHKLFVLKSTILNPKWISSFRSEIQFKSINLINIFFVWDWKKWTKTINCDDDVECPWVTFFDCFIRTLTIVTIVQKGISFICKFFTGIGRTVS